MKDIFEVHLTKQALKNLKKAPLHIAIKLQAWIEDVCHRGLYEVRKIKGYHDEPLKGKRNGQHSIRLSKSYRVIYIIDDRKQIRFVKILEVMKHEY